MDGNLDGVGNHVADRDPFGLVGDLAHVELAVFDDVVVGFGAVRNSFVMAKNDCAVE